VRMDQENEMELGQGHAPEQQSTVSYRLSSLITHR
jgi:hypothetical protein